MPQSPQTNVQHHGEETQNTNSHLTAKTQLKLSNQETPLAMKIGSSFRWRTDGGPRLFAGWEDSMCRMPHHLRPCLALESFQLFFFVLFAFCTCFKC